MVIYKCNHCNHKRELPEYIAKIIPDMQCYCGGMMFKEKKKDDEVKDGNT